MTIPDHLTGELRCLAALAAHDLDWPILRPGLPMPTVSAAAAAIGVETHLILKTVLFVDPTGLPVVALASGPFRIDCRLLAATVGLDKLALADTAIVLSVTGYHAGGVSPIGHRRAAPFVVDTALSSLPIAYAGGGEHDLLLKVDVARLTAITSATIDSITTTP